MRTESRTTGHSKHARESRTPQQPLTHQLIRVAQTRPKSIQDHLQPPAAFRGTILGEPLVSPSSDILCSVQVRGTISLSWRMTPQGSVSGSGYNQPMIMGWQASRLDYLAPRHWRNWTTFSIQIHQSVSSRTTRTPTRSCSMVISPASGITSTVI